MPFSKKLIATLKLVDKKEIKNLRKFIQFSSTDKITIAIFDYWDTQLKNSYAELDNETAWKYLFPKKIFLKDNWRTYCSLLNTLIEKFLIYEQLKTDEILQQRLLTKVLEKKKQAKKTYQKLEKLIENQPLSASKSLQLNQYYEALFEQNFKQKVDNKDDTLKYFFKHLDDFYFLQKLKFSNVALAQSTIFKKKISIFLLDEILSLTLQNTDNELITIHANLTKLYREDSKEQYELAIKYFDQHKEIISKEEQIVIFAHLQNFLIRKNNQGEKWVVIPLFELKKQGIELTITEITATSFVNTVSAGCLAKEFNYCETFIEKYQNSLPNANKEIVISLSNATLLFHRFIEKGDRDNLEKILEINKNISTLKGDLLYNLSLRLVISKTLFELYKLNSSYTAVLQNEIQKFKQYITQKKLSSEKTELYFNFCTYLQKISDKSHDSEALSTLKTEIQQLNVVNKKWLLEQC